MGYYENMNNTSLNKSISSLGPKELIMNRALELDKKAKI